MLQLPTTWSLAGLGRFIRSTPLSEYLASPHAKTTLCALAAIWLTREINRFLNHLALGNSVVTNWDWGREIVLVTGASGGIGEQVVRKLAKKAIKVVAVDIRPPPQNPFSKNVFYYNLDVTSTEDIHRVAQSIRREVGEPSVLVNNAGVAPMKPMLEETDEEIRRTFHVNIIAHFSLAREFLPYMIRKNHGHIVTIGSLGSYVTLASNVDYCSSKAATIAFHEGITQELRYRYNATQVRTSIVHPYWVQTRMTEALVSKRPFTEMLLGPSLVADAIVNLVLDGESRQLFIPGRMSLVTVIRGLPAWIQELIRNSTSDVLHGIHS